jgi:hypothetical protein
MAISELLSGAPDVHSLSHGAKLALRRVAIVVWLAIALGLGMEGLILVVRFTAGSHPATTQVLMELAQGVTWSFFVCAGVSLGTAIAKARASLGGLIGAISAPLAMGLAKGTQKAMVSALDVSAKPAILSLTTLGVLRAIEYGLLGWALASLASKERPRPLHFVAAGALIGACSAVASPLSPSRPPWRRTSRWHCRKPSPQASTKSYSPLAVRWSSMSRCKSAAK